MKIYFAYRTAYKPNLRYLKEFEANSIYDWFIENWHTLCSEEYSTLLGSDVYGFPIAVDAEEDSKPKDFAELMEMLERGVYVNELIGDKNCIKAATDDDEIELSWFFFNEDYKNSANEKLEIWFNEVLPVTYGSRGIKLAVSSDVLIPKEPREGCTYFLSSPIYDSSNLEDISVTKIEGIRLPDFLAYLQNNEIENTSYATSELNYIKLIANTLETNDLTTVLQTFADYPITELPQINNQTLAELQQLQLRNNREMSKVIVNEHLAEISSNSIGIFYNYFLLFDDLWIESNETLAKSIVYFGENWDI